MAIELTGTVTMSGENNPGVHVAVLFSDGVLRLTSGHELVGEWPIDDLGIHPLNEGYEIRAEGEEFILVTDDDAALADEMNIKTASPRLARQVAARHRPDEPDLPDPEPPLIPPKVGPIAFALSGALVLMGATILRTIETEASVSRGRTEVVDGLEFWLGFMLGGAMMVAAAYLLARRTGAAPGIALVVLALVAVLFGLAVSDTPFDQGHVTGYGFIAGGIAVGVAVVFSGSLETRR